MATPYLDAIMLFGDSLTQGGWEFNGLAAHLAHVYVRRFDVLNRGFSGYNTEWAIPVFEQIFAKKHERQHVAKVPLLTIWFGANDATFEGTLQHVPLSKFKANLKHLIHMVKNPESDYYSPETCIVLIAPPPVNSHQGVQNRDFMVTKSYAEAVVEIGKEEDVPVLDAWTVFWDASGHKEQALQTFLTDGLHPSGAGYELVYNELIKIIKEKYPELYHNNVRDAIATWEEVDPSNIRESVKIRSVKRPDGYICPDRS